MLRSGALPELRAIIQQYKVDTAGIELPMAGLNLGSRLYCVQSKSRVGKSVKDPTGLNRGSTACKLRECWDYRIV